MFRSLGIPYPPYLLRILGRTLVMWLLVKLLAVFFLGIVDGDPMLLSPSLGLPALLVHIDRHLAHERLLQRNLGASEWWLLGSTLAVCFILDMLVFAVASAGIAL